MSSTSPPTSWTRRLRRATSCAERPSARSSARACRQASRSDRAEASSGLSVVLERERMRRHTFCVMIPSKPLPYANCWDSPDQYVDSLLKFATTSDTFQILCGGVHILDFFTSDPGLYHWCIPPEWQPWLLQCDSMKLLDMLMRDDLDSLTDPQPPESFLRYIKDIRRFSLARDFSSDDRKLPKLTRQGSVGMKPKKIHEVRNFANYVDKLSRDYASHCGGDITHFVDFGSGQNYLGRALASAPYNKQIVAVEGREHNITGAKELDMFAGLSERPKIMRNKKLYLQHLASQKPEEQLDARVIKKALREVKPVPDEYTADLRSRKEFETIYEPEEGKGFIRYITGRLESGDLTDVVGQLEDDPLLENDEQKHLRLMAISIHSCGNLSHHGIRSLILNPRVQAIAIVGCCYNLMTEKLGPPTYKHPYMRPSLQALNGRIIRESAKRDPQGFPMSERLSIYQDVGVRFNITARMMACQAPQNWTEAESDSFFTRHFFRAVLQKMFLDRGVVTKVQYGSGADGADGSSQHQTPFTTSTVPVIIGSLRKSCYNSFHSYVRGAITKLTTTDDCHEHRDIIREKMADITDDEITEYEARFGPRKRELSAIWSLMAFSAVVVESLIVTDRWLFLRQHSNLVQHCWAETVFNYRESPRNLVVVGIKKPNP
ncbi:methyltransferase domain-containing protein [Xylariaceae sp. FL0016]|nr:methyltransferase domain-containing protein [Xylariaceae sp. FL0016]